MKVAHIGLFSLAGSLTEKTSPCSHLALIGSEDAYADPIEKERKAGDSISIDFLTLTEVPMTKLVYEHDELNKYRFVLGELGGRNLICVGLNPSRAEPGDYDPTMKRVEK